MAILKWNHFLCFLQVNAETDENDKFYLPDIVEVLQKQLHLVYDQFFLHENSTNWNS